MEYPHRAPTYRPGDPIYDPTPAEIAEATARIRAGWTTREYFERAGINPWSVHGTVEEVRAADLQGDWREPT